LTETVSDDNGTKDLTGVLTLLEDLKQSPTGTVIYDQVTRILDDYALVQKRIDRVYSLLIRMLLDAYASNPSKENVTRINSKLLQMYISHPSMTEEPEGTQPDSIEERVPVTTDAETIEHDAQRTRPRQTRVTQESPAPVTEDRYEKDHFPEAGDRNMETEEENEESPPDEVIGTIPTTERRVNSAYRLHLDRKRDEIEKLQETFAKNVAEAINQNREFGALLKIELAALQHAENPQEVENLRQILMGCIEELIQGHRLLGTKLHGTSDYLKLIKSDSERLRNELNKVRLLSLTDEFTGLPNRRAFMRRLKDEMGRAQRYGSPLSLALIDLDEFKNINDRHGHAAGDEVLRCYASHVLTILRHHDMVARYGGEEFAVLLPNTVDKSAVSAINKVKNRATGVCCDFDDKTLPMPTFSTGLTMYIPGEAPTSLIERADRALYRAKRLGRNRIEIERTSEIVAPVEPNTLQ
jgi:diguanylate cyclase